MITASLIGVEKMINVDLEEVPVHDQLPSPEEAKSEGTALSREPSAVDEEHNQLPDVEEYKTQLVAEDATNNKPRSKLSRRRQHRLILLIAVFIIMIAISITLGVVLGRDTAKSDDGDGPDDSSTEEAEDDFNPTPPFSSRRQQEVANAVSDWGWSDLSKVKTEDSPQFRAVTWIADYDRMRLEIEKNSTDLRQRYALAVFYYALNGDRWRYKDELNWLSENDVCNWKTYFKTTTGEPVDIGVLCGIGKDGKEVRQIFLPKMDLQGEIPDEISLLQLLEVVDLYSNDLSGELNPKIGELQSLKKIILHDNHLEGTFPEFLGKMSALQTIHLSRNLYTGAFPDLDGLANLETLNMGYNDLVDDLSKLSALKSIKVLVLANNTFTGHLRDDLLQNWPNIEVLDLSDCGIKDQFPPTIFQMPKLEVIDLHGNILVGTLSPRVVADSPVRLLAVQDNKISGQWGFLVDHMTKLEHLDLSNNQFIGGIPAMGHLTELRYLSLADNELFDKGGIPRSIFRLPKLVDLMLQNSMRTGPIPDGIGSMKNLVLLDLSYNELSGSIPSDIGGANNLNFLFLNRNKLDGTIPDSFSQLTNMYDLLLDHNDLVDGTDVICSPELPKLDNFIADCDQIGCDDMCCATECCSEDDPTCNDVTWDGELDPVAEYEYKRAFYKFHERDIVFPAKEPANDEQVSDSTPSEHANDGENDQGDQNNVDDGTTDNNNNDATADDEDSPPPPDNADIGEGNQDDQGDEQADGADDSSNADNGGDNQVDQGDEQADGAVDNSDANDGVDDSSPNEDANDNQGDNQGGDGANVVIINDGEA